jgi:hypothetical protein
MPSPTSRYYEPLAVRVAELEKLMILKGWRRAATKQAAAISFVVENLETLQAIVAEHKASHRSFEMSAKMPLK